MTRSFDPEDLDQNEGKYELYAARLVEDGDGASGAKKRLIRGLTALVGILIRSFKPILPDSMAADVDRVVGAAQDATTLLLSALAGKLESASKDGELKAAQISECYANERLANSQLGQIREADATERLRNALAQIVAIGVPVTQVTLPDGTTCLAIGEAVASRELQLALLSNAFVMVETKVVGTGKTVSAGIHVQGSGVVESLAPSEPTPGDIEGSEKAGGEIGPPPTSPTQDASPEQG